MPDRTISHYRTLKKIGRGGMAEVYEAVDLNTKRHIALKILLPHLSTDTVIRKRFLREAQVGLELNHPGIAEIYEVGDEQDDTFIAMELIKGNTLDEIMATETLDISQMLQIVIKITDAIAAAHVKKIIHRDIKPKNIMISGDKIKVMDFGLARILETSSLTDRFEILGTLHYMSPQQVTGEKLDERTDIFSLGVVLYQMLTNTLPFSGEHPGTILHAILYSDPLRMSETGRQIPVEIEQVVFKALRKKPNQRYQTITDLRTDLHNVRESIQGQSVKFIATEEVFEETPHGIYTALIGRESEMKTLNAHVDKMMKGESSTVLVQGEAGIGKSRIIWELGKRAKTMQARYLVGRCLYGEAGPPYQPVIKVIRDYFGVKDLKDSASINAFIDEKAPHLRGRLEIILTLLMLTGKDIMLINKEQLWDTISEIVKVISMDRPLILHIEDLQWADPATLNLLTYIVRNTSADRLLVIGTYRPEELTPTAEGIPHPLNQTMDMLNKYRLCNNLTLERLNIKDTTDVINSAFPNAEFPNTLSEIIHRESGGNPLFIIELLKMLKDTGTLVMRNGRWKINKTFANINIPPRISDIITNRLQRVSMDERNILNVAAVEGEIFNTDTLMVCLRIPRMRILRYLQNLETSHHLIHPSENGFMFDHNKIRDVIYKGMITELRKEYHSIIAEHYIEFYGKNDEHAAKIADHLMQADKEEDAIDHFIRAGRHAKKFFANQEAIGYFSKAYQILDKLLSKKASTAIQRKAMEIVKEKGDIYLRIDDYDNALADHRRLYKIAQSLDDKKNLAHALLGIGQSEDKKGNRASGFEYYSKALNLQRELGDRRGEGQTLQRTAVAYWETGDMDKAMQLCDKALKIGEQIGDDMLKANCFMWFGGINHILGKFAPSIKYCKDALLILKKNPDRNTEAECLHAISVNNYFLANFEEGLTYAERAIDLSRQIGNKFYEAWGYLDKCMIYRELGEYEAAMREVRKAMAIFDGINAPWGLGRCYVVETWVHDYEGNHQLTLKIIEKANEIATRCGDRIAEAFGLVLTVRAHAMLGDWDRVLQEIEKAKSLVAQYGPLESRTRLQAYIVDFWITIGDLQKAREHEEILQKMKNPLTTRIFDVDLCLVQAKVALAGLHFDRALEYGEKTLNIASGIKHARGINESMILMAEASYHKEETEQAERWALQAIEMAERIDRNDDIVKAHLLLGKIYLDRAEIIKTINYAENARKNAAKTDVKFLLWQAYYLIARAHALTKDRGAAVREYQNAKAVLNEIVSNLDSVLKKTFLSKDELIRFHADLQKIGNESHK